MRSGQQRVICEGMVSGTVYEGNYDVIGIDFVGTHIFVGSRFVIGLVYVCPVNIVVFADDYAEAESVRCRLELRVIGALIRHTVKYLSARGAGYF